MNIHDRVYRLACTLVAKTTVAWVVATVLFCADKLDATNWTLLTGSIFLGKAWMEFKSGPSMVKKVDGEGY